ncbi:MAG: alpha-amylase family glycosyl hydrolase [Bacteroidota bacterium]|jgi:glycosidase|nr:alpha-amylase family glycosyl hydrolase [Bacteroidota bacterium]
MRSLLLALVFLAGLFGANAQDSVDVTFRYFPDGNPTLVHLPGEFNNWANNSGGSINPGNGWTMVRQSDGSWEKTVRLNIGGGSGPDGAYEYKFNENGASTGWLADPLNPLTNGSYGNSIIHVRRPTIFHLQPLPGSIVRTATPELIADVFPATGQYIDTLASQVLVDGVRVATFGSAYDPATGILRVPLPAMTDGEHTVTVAAWEPHDHASSLATTFTVRAAPLQWLTRDNPRVRVTAMELMFVADGPDITDVLVVRNETDTLPAVPVGNVFAVQASLLEGENRFVAHGRTSGAAIQSGILRLVRVIDHAPHAEIQLGFSGGTVNLNAYASTDPDGDALTFHWRSEDDRNPLPLGVDHDGAHISFAPPAKPGEYYFTLEARDPDANAGIARNYVRIVQDADPTLGRVDENPSWVRDAIVYEIFVPAFSSRGDLHGVIDGMPHIKQLGVNTIWLMPIMDNLGTTNAFNGGYNIIDFYNVDESLGTLADFDRLIDSARANDLRVILDMTPNHVSGSHPWVEDIRQWLGHSIYRGYIESRVLGGDRGLGQSVVEQHGYPLYARYSNWTLANLNLSNAETREAMMDVHRYWLVDRRADGFRLDVYWGPQERYGAATWWRPFREEIKRYKPDVFLLGETDGTGPGSEINYADGGGALDAGYDWSWYGQIKSTLGNGDVAALHSRTSNYSPNLHYNHHTGANASYFRFLENHDEDRIAQIFQSTPPRSMPGAAVMFTAPGIPLIYAGQEIGWRGQRDRIAFTSPPQPALLPYYRRLASIRSMWPALRSPRIAPILHGTPGTYAFLRPGLDENIIVAANFRDIPVTVTLDVPVDKLELSAPPLADDVLYLNDLMVDSTFSLRGEDLRAFRFDLAPFQTRTLLLSDSAMFALVTGMTPLRDAAPMTFGIDATFPNPLPSGHASTIRYTLDGPIGQRSIVRCTVHDQLGRERFRGAPWERARGTHSESIDLGSLPAGQYHLRLQATDPSTGMIRMDTRPVTILR